MTPCELVAEFTRVRAEPATDAIVLEVCVFEWRPGNCMPVPEWFEAGRLPLTASGAEIERARSVLLENSRHFARCARCDGRQPGGYSFADRCQVCG